MENEFIVYYFVGAIIILLLVVAIITYAFLHQKKVVQLKTQLHEEELRRQQATFEALQDGQEKERARLAQELHDGIGAKLSGIKMNLEYLDINAKEHKELISRIFEGITETLEEVREVSHNLLPYQLNSKGIRALLLNCVDQFNAYGNCIYDLFMEEVDIDLNETVKIHIYRMIAELLNNVHKHARATMTSIQVSVQEGNMEIMVEDNGIGLMLNPADIEGIGLKNINSRVAICKGTINIDSSDKGTSVIIEIPLNAKP